MALTIAYMYHNWYKRKTPFETKAAAVVAVQPTRQPHAHVGGQIMCGL
jgi:hypothetical protein